jgi:acetyltransferase-like isoleucine patch superfamily enzyme
MTLAEPRVASRERTNTLHFEVVNDYQARLSALGIRGMRFNRFGAITARLTVEPPAFVAGHLDQSTPISIGAFTLINGGRIAYAKIGRYCSIAGDVAIGASEHPLDRISMSTLTFAPDFHGWDDFYDARRKQEFRAKAVKFVGRHETNIGHDVWLGLGAFIKAGVTIGTGAVIGAGAVVVKDIPPYAIAAGVPATVKRYRYPPDQIERLLASQWWQYSLYDLLGEELKDPNKFCDLLEQKIAAGEIAPYRPEPLTAETIRDAIARRVSAAVG